MRYVIVVLVLVALVFSYYVWGPQARRASANGKTVSSGVIHYGNENLASLKGNGIVTLEGTTVRNMLVVNGSLDAKDARIGALQVNGHATLTGSTVEGKSEINGFLNADNSNFNSDMEISAHKVKFQECNVDSLVIKKPLWAFGSQVVELAKKTICRGPITFEAGNGKIILSGDSQILGAVQGAEIERQ